MNRAGIGAGVPLPTARSPTGAAALGPARRLPSARARPPDRAVAADAPNRVRPTSSAWWNVSTRSVRDRRGPALRGRGEAWQSSSRTRSRRDHRCARHGIWALAHVLPASHGAMQLGDNCFVESGVCAPATTCGQERRPSGSTSTSATRLPRSQRVLTKDRFRAASIASGSLRRVDRGGVTVGGTRHRCACGWARACTGAPARGHSRVRRRRWVRGNPARRHGWVCWCGRPLAAGSAPEAACSRCGRTYAVSDSAVTEIDGAKHEEPLLHPDLQSGS